jgi:hypothetical protein
MGTWGTDIFEDDDALDMIARETTRLFRLATETLNQHRDGAALACLELARRVAGDGDPHNVLPDPARLDKLAEKYLERFDQDIAPGYRRPEQATERRERIVEVLDALQRASRAAASRAAVVDATLGRIAGPAVAEPGAEPDILTQRGVSDRRKTDSDDSSTGYGFRFETPPRPGRR